MPNDDEPATDFRSRDDAAPLMTAGLLVGRRDLSPEMFTRYWRDVHGPLAARIHGFHQYWQHHLGAPQRAFWAIPGIDEVVSDTYRIDGFAETTFRDAADRDRLRRDPAAQALWHDEQNVFAATYLCPSATGDSRTLLDRFHNGAPQGKRSAPTYVVLLRRAETASQETLASYLRDRFAPALARSPDVAKTRLHLLQSFDASAWDTPGVSHDLPAAAQHHAILELAFRDAAAHQRLLASSGLQAILAELPGIVTRMHTYPVTEVYTLVYEDRPTLVGLKGLPSMEAIVACGARNQVSPEVLKLLHGPETRDASAVAFPGR